MFVVARALLKQWAPTGLALVAAVALFATWDVSTAAASCGDYVTFRHQSSGLAAQPVERGDDHSAPGAPQCRGPNCRQQAPLPAPPAKGFPTASSIDWAFWSAAASASGPSLTGWIFERRLQPAEGHSFPLLRPPSLG